jgi:hypothetical protein
MLLRPPIELYRKKFYASLGSHKIKNLDGGPCLCASNESSRQGGKQNIKLRKAKISVVLLFKLKI